MDKAAPQEIRAVFFDIGNVLVRFDVAAVMRRIAWTVGMRPLRVARLLWSRRLVDGIERGEITGSELYAVFQEELGYGGEFRDFMSLWCDNFEPDRKALAILRAVCRRRPTYLLSNTNRPHYEFLRARYAFPKQVRGAVLSYELGLRKPERAIYEAALALAGVPAANALFIDDLAENVNGALRAGLQALHFTGAEALRKELKLLGVL